MIKYAHHLVSLVLCEGAMEVILDILLEELWMTQLPQLAEQLKQLLGSLRKKSHMTGT